MQRQFFDAHEQQEGKHQAQISQEQLLYGSLSTPELYPLPTPLANMNYGQAHIMPEPSTEPWKIDLMPWKMPTTSSMGGEDGVMQFSARFQDEALDRRLQLHQKRKSEILPEHPAKQFISEERFTAHFNGLHISSDYVQQKNQTSNRETNNMDEQPSTTGVCFTNRTYEDYRITAKELEEKLLKANRITICNEVKKLYEDQNKMNFMPEALMHHQEKPCKALVLWQPSPLDMIKNSSTLSELVGNTASTSKILSVHDKKDQRKKNEKQKNNPTNYVADEVVLNNDPQDVEIDDFIDNNNTSSLDFNNCKQDGMDEDL